MNINMIGARDVTVIDTVLTVADPTVEKRVDVTVRARLWYRCMLLKWFWGGYSRCYCVNYFLYYSLCFVVATVCAVL